MNNNPYSIPYDDLCPNCDRTVAKLVVLPDEIDPHLITEALGEKPTTIAKKGEKTRDDRSPSPLNLWALSSEDKVQSLELRRHLDWLLEKLYPKRTQLLQLQEHPGVKMRIECVWWARLGGGPTLWPIQMRALAELNLECCFDLMFFGEEE